jgi:hypothetical protein
LATFVRDADVTRGVDSSTVPFCGMPLSRRMKGVLKTTKGMLNATQDSTQSGPTSVGLDVEVKEVEDERRAATPWLARLSADEQPVLNSEPGPGPWLAAAGTAAHPWAASDRSAA